MFVLDEIDKIGSDLRRPLLCPTRSVGSRAKRFVFRQLFVYQLRFVESALYCYCQQSKLYLSTLLDRMELINVGGYILEEKVEIAKATYFQKVDNHGIKRSEFTIPKNT